MTLDSILAALGDHPWASQITVLDTVDSTNTFAKALAAQGAPHGTVVLAECQTGGRGRLGRSFSSPRPSRMLAVAVITLPLLMT